MPLVEDVLRGLKTYCVPATVCGETTLNWQGWPDVQISVTGVVYVPGAQPVSVEVKARPEGELVMVALPAGSVGANDIPLKLESGGAAASCVNVVPGFVVAETTSLIP